MKLIPKGYIRDRNSMTYFWGWFMRVRWGSALGRYTRDRRIQIAAPNVSTRASIYSYRNTFETLINRSKSKFNVLERHALSVYSFHFRDFGFGLWYPVTGHDRNRAIIPPNGMNWSSWWDPRGQQKTFPIRVRSNGFSGSDTYLSFWVNRSAVAPNASRGRLAIFSASAISFPAAARARSPSLSAIWLIFHGADITRTAVYDSRFPVTRSWKGKKRLFIFLIPPQSIFAMHRETKSLTKTASTISLYG